MTSRPPSQCGFCRHFLSPLDDESVDEAARTCSAFSAGIPDEIWWNRADHRQPYPEDGGIRWAPLDKGTKYPAEEVP